MTKREESMQVICDEKWVVEIGNKQFTLTKKQTDMLKEASTKGFRGIVWFEKFAISIPHIQYIKRLVRDYWRIEGTSKTKISRSEYESQLLLTDGKPRCV